MKAVMKEGAPVHPKNTLNDLTPKEWLKETKSWFVLDAGTEQEWKTKKAHPATFPRTLAVKFIRCYTKRGGHVLDPMAGSGSTLFAAMTTGREATGFDIYQSMADLYQEIAEKEYGMGETEHPDSFPHYIVGDATEILKDWPDHMRGEIDYVLFSPPYGRMLKKSSGGVETRHKKRAKEGLALDYGGDSGDIGNMTEIDYFTWLERLANCIWPILKPGKRMTIICQNEMRNSVNPLAWRLAERIIDTPGWEFESYRIWCQDSKKLGIWGHPKNLLTNNHHHYCMTFKRVSMKRLAI